MAASRPRLPRGAAANPNDPDGPGLARRYSGSDFKRFSGNGPWVTLVPISVFAPLKTLLLWLSGLRGKSPPGDRCN